MSEIKTNKISPRKGTTQIIGDSGDTVNIPCGATLNLQGTFSNSGTVTGIDGLISWDTTAKTTNFTAASGNGYFINTTSGAITVTFPASPIAGDVIGLKDYTNTFDTNNLTIDPNGNNIQGIANNFIISVEGTATQFIYVDATRGWVLTDASKASDIQGPAFTAATGGTITTSGDYKIHTFTGPGTFTVTQIGNASTIPTGGPSDVDYVVVAGGGGGGGYVRGGGGGAGGFRESHCSTTSGCYTASPLASCSSLPISVTSYPITVGGGGAGGNGPPLEQGCNGSNSIFSIITSSGGGGGGGGQPGSTSPLRIGVSGASGGGGGSGGASTVPGGNGNTPPVSPPQGNAGGPQSGGANQGGAGGGGATAVGGPSDNSPYGPGADGAAGATTSISGSPTAYAGGGAGGSLDACGTGTGGVGGGGPEATNGTTNTGGGGGGGNPVANGGTGGSGIVIIRYKYQ